jgi:hypothetical protein
VWRWPDKGQTGCGRRRGRACCHFFAKVISTQMPVIVLELYRSHSSPKMTRDQINQPQVSSLFVRHSEPCTLSFLDLVVSFGLIRSLVYWHCLRLKVIHDSFWVVIDMVRSPSYKRRHLNGRDVLICYWKVLSDLRVLFRLFLLVVD